MDQQKQKKTLLLFLRNCLEEETIPGLSWIDKDRKIWKLPWKIHRPTVLGEPDAMVLCAWAVYKYSYREKEPSKKELSKWKENLRNSLLTSPHIEEKENLHEQKIPYPYKVYQFIDPKSKSEEVNNNVIKSLESLQGNHNQDMCRAESSNLPNFSVLDSPIGWQQELLSEKALSLTNDTLTDSQDLSEESLYSFFDAEFSFVENGLEVCQENSTPNQRHLCDPQIEDFQFPDSPSIPFTLTHPQEMQHSVYECEEQKILRSRSPIERKLVGIVQGTPRLDHKIPKLDTSTSVLDAYSFVGQRDFDSNKFLEKGDSLDILLDSELCTEKSPIDGYDDISLLKSISDAYPLSVSVAYIAHPVMLNPNLMHEKFKLCYVESDGMRGSILQCPTSAQFGPSDAFLMELPHPSKIKKLKTEHKQIVLTLLNNMKRGITVSCSGGDILVTRYCKAVAYNVTQGNQCIKLERDQQVKIFDFKKFLAHVDRTGPFCSSPTPDVKITFGVKFSKVEVVTLTITHLEAQRILQERKNRELQVYLEPDCSLSNEFDKRLSIEQKLKNIHCDL